MIYVILICNTWVDTYINYTVINKYNIIDNYYLKMSLLLIVTNHGFIRKNPHKHSVTESYPQLQQFTSFNNRILPVSQEGFNKESLLPPTKGQPLKESAWVIFKQSSEQTQQPNLSTYTLFLYYYYTWDGRLWRLLLLNGNST